MNDDGTVSILDDTADTFPDDTAKIGEYQTKYLRQWVDLLEALDVKKVEVYIDGSGDGSALLAKNPDNPDKWNTGSERYASVAPLICEVDVTAKDVGAHEKMKELERFMGEDQ